MGWRSQAGFSIIHPKSSVTPLLHSPQGALQTGPCWSCLSPFQAEPPAPAGTAFPVPCPGQIPLQEKPQASPNTAKGSGTSAERRGGTCARESLRHQRHLGSSSSSLQGTARSLPWQAGLVATPAELLARGGSLAGLCSTPQSGSSALTLSQPLCLGPTRPQGHLGHPGPHPCIWPCQSWTRCCFQP